jgi:hypothetical protein
LTLKQKNSTLLRLDEVILNIERSKNVTAIWYLCSTEQTKEKTDPRIFKKNVYSRWTKSYKKKTEQGKKKIDRRIKNKQVTSFSLETEGAKVVMME